MTRGRIAWKLAILAVCVGALVLTVRSLDPRRVVEAARGADLRWLLLSVAFVIARFAVWGAKWTNMLRRQGRVGYGDVLRAVMAGSFVNLTTPTAKIAGGIVRAAMVARRTGWRRVTAYGWALADQYTNLLGNLALGGAAAFGARYPAAGCVALGTLLLALVLRSPAFRLASHPAPARWIARITPKRFTTDATGRSADWLREVLRPALETGSTWTAVPLDVVLAGLSWGSMCVANALVFRALGVEASIPAITLSLIAAAVLGTVSPGGIGATEAILIPLLISQGVHGEVAAAGALVHRATYYLVILVWGGGSLVGSRELLRSADLSGTSAR